MLENYIIEKLPDLLLRFSIIIFFFAGLFKAMKILKHFNIEFVIAAIALILNGVLRYFDIQFTGLIIRTATLLVLGSIIIKISRKLSVGLIKSLLTAIFSLLTAIFLLGLVFVEPMLLVVGMPIFFLFIIAWYASDAETPPSVFNSNFLRDLKRSWAEIDWAEIDAEHARKVARERQEYHDYLIARAHDKFREDTLGY
ncbi:hypothetical protein GMJAKD_12180 [Candidatus Electrothrix aarhusensis]